MDRMRVAQVGTRHGHAAGKLRAMLDSSELEVVGVYEPDADRRAEVGSEAPWNGIDWFDSMEGILTDDSIVLVVLRGSQQSRVWIRPRPWLTPASTFGTTSRRDRTGSSGSAWWKQARGQGTQLQMGYMFRYHEGFLSGGGLDSQWFPGGRVRPAGPHVHQRGRGTAPSGRGASGRHILRPGQPHARPGGLDAGTTD